MRLIIPADLLKARRKKPVEGQLSLFGVSAPKPAPKAPAPKPKRSAGGRGGGSGRGKAAPGETRQWADGTYQKQADGTWKKVSDNGRKETKGAGGAVPGVLGASGRGKDVRGQDRPSGGGKEKRAREVAEEIKSEDPTPVTPETALPDGRPLAIKPPSERSPAIAIYPDLWPQDDEIPPIPGHIARFPNPAELRTSSGKVTGMISELFSHQVDGVRRIMYAWQNGNGALLQDSAGLGKTNTAIAALVANEGKRNLIVVPVAGKEGLKAQWIGEHAAGLYGIDVKGAKVRTTKTGKQAVDFVADELSSTEPGTYIVSYDELYETERDEKGEIVRNEKGKPKKRLRKSLFDGKWDAIAFDESHTMQSRGKLLSDAGKAIQERADKVLYMSATPFTNISDMHYLTKLGLFDSSDEGFAKWAEQAGATVKGQKINNPSSHLPMAAIAATLHANGLSIKREISLEGVSSKFDQLKQAKLTDEQAKAFETADKIIDMASAAIPKEYLKALYIGWTRQYWEICKVDRAVELGRKALDSGKQVAFFTSYKSADHAHLRAIPRMLSKRAARLSMSDSPYQQRRAEELAQLAEDIGEVVNTLPAGDSAVKRLVDAFGGGGSVAEVHGDSKKKPAQEQASYQSGEKRVFVATMSKGGTGISLHDTTGERPRVQINLSLPWSAREFNQVAGRSHRLGSKSDTEMYWMVGEDDSEARNGAKVAKRLQSMGSLTAGNPELTVDAGQLLAWEFEGTSQISDDENDIIAALTEADASPEEADDRRLEGTADAEHAQAARDHFREYAERIRAGGDVIKERYKEAQDRKKQLAFRESRRAAEQLRQRHGFAIHWRSYAGAWEIDRADLTDYQAKLLKKKAIDGRGVTYGGREIVAFRVKPDGLRALSVELGSSDLKVDIPSVSEHLDPSKRGEAEKAVDELGEKGLRARFWGHSGDGQPVYLVTGRTWDNKAALGAVGRFARIDNEKGYLVAESYLPAVVENMKKLGNWGEKFVTHPAPYRDRPGPDKPAQHQKRTHLAKSRRLVIRAT